MALNKKARAGVSQDLRGYSKCYTWMAVNWQGTRHIRPTVP